MKALRSLLSSAVVVGVLMPAPGMIAMQESRALMRLDNAIVRNKADIVIGMAERIFEYESDAVQQQARKKIKDYLPSVQDEAQKQQLQKALITPETRIAVDEEEVKKNVDQKQIKEMQAKLQPAPSVARVRDSEQEEIPARGQYEQLQEDILLPQPDTHRDAEIARAEQEKENIAGQRQPSAAQPAPRNSWNRNLMIASILTVAAAIGAYFWFFRNK